MEIDEVLEPVDELYEGIRSERTEMKYVAAMESHEYADLALADIERDALSHREWGIYLAGMVEGIARSKNRIEDFRE